MVAKNGETAPVDTVETTDDDDDDDNFKFSPAVERAWKKIEVGSRKTHLEELRDQRQDSLVKSMSNVRTSKTMLELKENELEDRGPVGSAVERQAREAGVIRARLELENALQECDALAEELEMLAVAISEHEDAGKAPMIGGNRATRRRDQR